MVQPLPHDDGAFEDDPAGYLAAHKHENTNENTEQPAPFYIEISDLGKKLAAQKPDSPHRAEADPSASEIGQQITETRGLFRERTQTNAEKTPGREKLSRKLFYTHNFIELKENGCVVLSLEPEMIHELQFAGSHIFVKRDETGQALYRIAETGSDYQPLQETKFQIDPDQGLEVSELEDFSLKITPYEKSFGIFSGNAPAKVFMTESRDFDISQFANLTDEEREVLQSQQRSLSHECLKAFQRGDCLEGLIEGTPRRIFKGYELGAGGFGKVQNGFYIADGEIKTCVVKQYLPEAYSSMEVMDIEMRNAGLLMDFQKNDQNYPDTLIKVLGVNTPHQAPFIVFEKYQDRMLGSVNLRSYMETASFQQSTFVDRIDILLDIARALNYLHDKGLSHHDAKPANVMKADKAVLIDIDGITRFKGDERELMTKTPDYSDPVLWEHRGPEYDIFTFGRIAYDLFEHYHFRSPQQADETLKLSKKCQLVVDSVIKRRPPAFTMPEIIKYLENLRTKYQS